MLHFIAASGRFRAETFMANQEIEITDVVVVLDELDDPTTEQVVIKLKGIGLCVETVDNDNSVVEGSIDTNRMHDLKKIEHVRYVRQVFSYLAENGSGESAADEDDYEE
jgi:hypothetical protein